MPGFKKQKDIDSDIGDFNFDTTDFDDDFDDEENDEVSMDEQTTQDGTPRVVKKEEKKLDKGKIIIGACVCVVIAVVGVAGFVIHKTNKANKEEKARLEQSYEDAKKAKEAQDAEENKVTPGVPNFYAEGSGQNNSSVSDGKKITTDLNGEPVDPNYKIQSIDIKKDFINYTKYRAVTDKGMEFYWLETYYKNKKYKVQVPYSIYEKLEKSGITVCDVEVLTLEGGSQVVTYMNVRKDAQSLLERDDE